MLAISNSQTAVSVITVINTALETRLFFCAHFNVLQVGTFIQVTECSWTICFLGPKATCIHICVWISKNLCQPASSLVVSCHNIVLLFSKQSIAEKGLWFPILFWHNVMLCIILSLENCGCVFVCIEYWPKDFFLILSSTFIAKKIQFWKMQVITSNAYATPSPLERGHHHSEKTWISLCFNMECKF